MPRTITRQPVNPVARAQWQARMATLNFESSPVIATTRLAGSTTKPGPVVLEILSQSGILLPAIKMRYIDGVFEGGGTLGTAYIGALRALSDNGIWFRRVVGTSAGSITAALIAVGYSVRDIQWLSTPEILRGPRPKSVPNDIDPVVFLDFLDLPDSADDISEKSRQKTALWQALKGQAIDNMLKKTIDVPTRDETVNQIVNAIMNLKFGGGPMIPEKVGFGPAEVDVKKKIKNVVKTGLIFLPTSKPKLNDFLPFSTEKVRKVFADVVWKAYANIDPGYRLLVHIAYDGGIATGDEFLSTMRRMLGAKVFNNPQKDVKFKDLPMECALIAVDTHSKKIQIYSKKITPDMSVAEAVRRSMSVPFLFEPRKQGNHEIMDGGLCANYPYWLLSAAGNGLIDDNDDKRMRFGFILEDAKNPPSSWKCNPPKFKTANGNPKEPSSMEGLASNAGLDGLHGAKTEVSSLERVFRVQKTVMETQQNLHQYIAPSLMKGLTFHEVKIPLKGYSWLDFQISEEPETFLGMADRGWQATMKLLEKQNLLFNGSTTLPPLQASPYRF